MTSSSHRYSRKWAWTEKALYHRIIHIFQAFNGTTTRPWGYIDLMVSVGNGRDIRFINTRFLVILHRSL